MFMCNVLSHLARQKLGRNKNTKDIFCIEMVMSCVGHVRGHCFKFDTFSFFENCFKHFSQRSTWRQVSFFIRFGNFTTSNNMKRGVKCFPLQHLKKKKKTNKNQKINWCKKTGDERCLMLAGPMFMTLMMMNMRMMIAAPCVA